MRNPKAIAMLVLSVVIGLGATIVAAGWISQQANVASTKVVVAAADIQLGSRLNSQMLKTIDWPAGSIPTGAMTKAEPLEDRVVKTSILRGEPILEAKLAPVGTKGGLSAVIPEGKSSASLDLPFPATMSTSWSILSLTAPGAETGRYRRSCWRTSLCWLSPRRRAAMRRSRE
jgi:Flp pilus assembly protein CpaB